LEIEKRELGLLGCDVGERNLVIDKKTVCAVIRATPHAKLLYVDP
jgi:hypothetical protein